MLLLPLIIIVVFLLMTIKPMVSSKLFSPIFIHTGLLAVIMMTAAGYYFLIEDKIYLYELEDIPLDLFLQPMQYYLVAMNATLLGFILFYGLQNKRTKQSLLKKIDFDQFIYEKSGTLNVPVFLPAFLLVIAIVGLFLTYGSGFWERDNYLEEQYRALQTFLKVEGFLFLISNALIFKKNPILSRTQIFIFLLFSLTTGSRKLFVLYLFHIFITYLLTEKAKRNKSLLIFSFIFSLIILSYVMPLRSLPAHGLIPYLVNFDVVIEQMKENLMFVIYYISAFSYFVTANVLEVYQSAFSWKDIWIALNPALGTWAGWYEINDLMRLNIFVPYNSYGEVFSGGYLFTFVFYYFLGTSYGFFEKHIRDHYQRGNILFALILLVLVVYSILVAQQYNLRSAMRFIYYGFALISFSSLYSLFINRQRKLPPI